MSYSRSVLIVLLFSAAILIGGCGAPSEAEVSLENSEPSPTVPAPTSTSMPSPTEMPPSSTPKPDIEIDLGMDIAEGDPAVGKNRALTHGCMQCHAPLKEEYENHGPHFIASDDLPGIFERGELRMADPAYEGRAATNMEYIIESIFLPEVYVVPGDWEGTMPTYFHARLTDKDLANIIAWMRTIEETAASN